MIGSPDFSQPPAVEYFFLNCIPYKARCAPVSYTHLTLPTKLEV